MLLILRKFDHSYHPNAVHHIAHVRDRITTMQYNTMKNLHSKTDKQNCQFNLAHKLKRTEMFKRKMK